MDRISVVFLLCLKIYIAPITTSGISFWEMTCTESIRGFFVIYVI
jgi:hypothetical protein